jgi:hypothetical protein
VTVQGIRRYGASTKRGYDGRGKSYIALDIPFLVSRDGGVGGSIRGVDGGDVVC